MENSTPIPRACDMSALAPAERLAHGQTTEKLSRLVSGVDEFSDGYRLTFPNETRTITLIGQFVAYERLCCPFLNFGLEVGARQDSIRLSLTGPENVKEFLQAEFAGALQSL